ncbi:MULTISPECIES: SOS response-associated peptidase [Dietzia]|uniref:Abasic site processing protein n=1 Tax=Dietzia cinnamea TaxID=321318 RepID=A0AAW5Q7D3_9ACTN|nr:MULTISPECIES: SOS response-associated peptidase [Dietzia]MBM7232053.1 SOS response-associated peptidase [Dietzia cinnamea]MCT1865269.1 SOS response-associated peptidase [Dietzia cinnamea]MCT2030571.1 SOS response-associated peptidase [Dietzia cinnamea]MCT2034089.1 SOS response-associated peptidase [Dietzia cinnamea]MCT2077835.1 SOS response-associated peptidase [Dietzia cinnamea]
MCGRYSVAISGTALVSVLDLDSAEPSFEWSPTYSVAPRTRAPVIRDRLIRDRLIGDQRVREAFLPTWGLRPSWAKEKGPRPINARLETAATNGMFRSAFASARAVVPMTGYFEWQESVEAGKKVKNPSYVHGPDDELLLAAGLLAFHREGEDADWRTTFTIITRTGEDAAGEVHDRMPVFLTPAAWDTWLAPGKINKDQAGDLLDLLDVESRSVAATLRTRPVSRAVNNVRTLDRYDSRLIDPVR